MFDILVPLLAGLAFSLLARAEARPCPPGAVSVDVTSTADVQNLTEALACTGEGAFNITWYSNLTITQRMEVSDRKDVTVNGVDFPSIRGALADDNDAGAVVDIGARNSTGLFFVSNESTLRLNNMVLEGGNAERGAVVEMFSFSSLFVFGCTFANNKAFAGGVIYASTSSIYVAGNTSFNDNSAENGGVFFLVSNSSLRGDGNISFLNNSAEVDGGALAASMHSSIDLHGDIVFDGNSAGQNGGAIILRDACSMNVDGGTSFVHNAASNDGGALYIGKSSFVGMNGSGSFDNNFAERDGGALYIDKSSSIGMNGNGSFYNNFAERDGGALYIDRSSFIGMNGNGSFHHNFAERDGGAIYLWSDAEASVNGSASFMNNIAKERGGALFASDDSIMVFEGDSVFGTNLAGTDGGAIYLQENCTVQTVGSTSFFNNFAEDVGGAMSASESYIHIDGDNHLYNNSATNVGGGINLVEDSVLTIDGNTLFSNHSAGNSGGVLYASQSTVYIDGHTSATYCSAGSPGGGFFYATQSDVNIYGSTYITHNSGHDGGAILAQESFISITGNATFAYNAADRDGGAIKAIDTSLTIGTMIPGTELTSTSALLVPRGFKATMLFVGNTARDFGGALSLANPVALNVSDVTFASSVAESGGAVSVTSTDWAIADFQRCQFESNKGTRGGALYFNGDGQRLIHDSSLRLNVAENTGGAVFNAGTLVIQRAVFTENMATGGGLAIQNSDSSASAVVMRDVEFNGNILGCPSQTYSSTQDSSPDSCRFKLACAECLDSCEVDLNNVIIDRETLPTCKPVPEGVSPPSTAITLQTFDIKEGYYRVSTDSATVLECYQMGACTGGVDPADYCAVGYTGPYCAVCTQDFAPGPSRRCHECSGENRGSAVIFSTVVMILALFVVLFVVSYLLKTVEDGSNDAQTRPRRWWQGNLPRFRGFLDKPLPSSAIKIIVVVLQIVIQFTEIAGAVYPDEYERFLSSLVLINFDLGSIMSASCFFTLNFYDRLVLVTVTPIVILLGCGATFVIATARNKDSPSARPIVKQKHWSVAQFVVFFVYSSVSFTILQTFVCDSLDDGNAYLRADYSITCYTETYTAYLIYAILMVCVYPVGIPAFLAFWLASHRRELKQSDRETRPNLSSFRSLWAAYKPSCYYYEVVESARRILLTGAAVFILPDSAEQVAAVLFFAVVFVFISESISPFESDSDMWMYRWGNGIILASMYVALLLKADLAEEGSQGSSVITILLIAANVFMIFTVVVQTVLSTKGICESKVREDIDIATHQREESGIFGIEPELSRNM